MTLVDATSQPVSVAATDPVLRVDDLSVHFARFFAVRKVSFELRPGDLLGLIGPNGAGKTTLLRCIAGLQVASKGSVRVLGEPIGPALPALRYVGFTPDTPAFYEELTVRQFLSFIARGYGLSPAEGDERIDFWLEKVWLSEKGDQKIRGLSRGMRQRVGIARTLLPNPAVVLLDEPASGLDPAGRVQFRELLLDLRKQGKVLIVSSHILSDMEEYCSHAAIMSGGKLLRFGTISQIAHAAIARQRFMLDVVSDAEPLGPLLASIEGIEIVSINETKAILDGPPGKDAAATLLATLLARGLAVCAFHPEATGLEEAYLRSGVGQVD